MAGAYSMSSLLEMKDAVGSCSTLFMSNLSMYASLGNSLELRVSHHLRGRRSKPQPRSVILLQTRLRYYAFDVVVSLTFGKKVGFFDRGKDMDAMMEAIQGMLVYASQIGQVPYLHQILLGNPLFRILVPSMETWKLVLQFILRPSTSATRFSEMASLKLSEAKLGGIN